MADESNKRLLTAQWVMDVNLKWIAAAEVKTGVVVTLSVAMLGGLAGNAAALSVDAGDWIAQPTNTRDALATGAIDAMVGAIEHGHARLQQRLLERGVRIVPRIILTGGSGYRLLAHLPAGNAVIDSLVLEGVYLLAKSSADIPAPI